MNFEFPDENIMLVIDREEPGPNEGPEKGSGWTMVFDGASNTLGNGIGVGIISPEILQHTELSTHWAIISTHEILPKIHK